MARPFVAGIVALCATARAYDTQWRTVKSDSSWIFLERFCLSGFSKKSWMKLRVRSTGGILLLYQDAGLDSFKSIYKASHSSMPLGSRVLAADSVWRLRRNETVFENEFELHTARYIFLVFANYDEACGGACPPTPLTVESAFCDSEVSSACAGPSRLEYRFRFLNKGYGRTLREFSYDELALFPTSITFFCLYSILLVISALVRRMLVVKRKLHFSARMLCDSVLIEWCSHLLSLQFYWQFAVRGSAPSMLLASSRALRSLVDLELVLLFVILAKGWTVVRRKLEASSRIKLAICGSTYGIVSLVAQAWSIIAYHPAKISFTYDGYPSVFLAVVRLAATVWFWYSVRTTLRTFASKQGFFRKLRFFGIAWFVSLPTSVLVAHVCDDTYRASVFHTIDNIGVASAHIGLVLMYNPSTQFNQTFPFHTMTTESLGLLKRRPNRLRNALNLPTSSSVRRCSESNDRWSNDASEIDQFLDGKLIIDDADERLHLRRTSVVISALLDRLPILAQLSTDLRNALDLVDIPDKFTQTLAAPAIRLRGIDSKLHSAHVRPMRRRAQSKEDNRVFAGPRTLLDDAIDETLAEYSVAGSRLRTEREQFASFPNEPRYSSSRIRQKPPPSPPPSPLMPKFHNTTSFR